MYITICLFVLTVFLFVIDKQYQTRAFELDRAGDTYLDRHDGSPRASEVDKSLLKSAYDRYRQAGRYYSRALVCGISKYVLLFAALVSLEMWIGYISWLI